MSYLDLLGDTKFDLNMLGFIFGLFLTLTIVIIVVLVIIGIDKVIHANIEGPIIVLFAVLITVFIGIAMLYRIDGSLFINTSIAEESYKFTNVGLTDNPLKAAEDKLAGKGIIFYKPDIFKVEDIEGQDLEIIVEKVTYSTKYDIFTASKFKTRANNSIKYVLKEIKY